MTNKDIHLEILKLTVQTLGDLTNELVFIGGSTISLYITEPEVVQIRETLDVDCVVEVSNRTEYQSIVEKLGKKGFHEDMHGKVICRYKKDSLILDVMPTDERILGFSNKWYKPAIKNAIDVQIENTSIKIFSPAYLLASKIEAFKGRGKNSFMFSTDIEDIVTLFDGRSSLTDELLNSPADVQEDLRKELSIFFSNPAFLDAIEGHISDRQNTAGRKSIIIERIKRFINKA